MSPEVQAFGSGFPLTLLHAAATLAIWSGALALHLRFSPHREGEGLARSEPFAALAAGGAALGLAAPLAVSLTASASLVEILLWGGGLGAAQLLLFRLVDLGFAPLRAGLAERRWESALVLAAARLGSAAILAAAAAG